MFAIEAHAGRVGSGRRHAYRRKGMIVSPTARSGPHDADLDAAVSGVGLDPAFQPITALADGSVVGFEALTRWRALRSEERRVGKECGRTCRCRWTQEP